MQMTRKTSKKTDLAPRTIDCGDGKTAIVDAEMYGFLVQYKWRSVRGKRSFYARVDRQNEKRRFCVYMHRLIANTPSLQVCHHRNRNTLDNRRSNLVNMSRVDHKMCHLNDTLSVKFADMPLAASPPPEL